MNSTALYDSWDPKPLAIGPRSALNHLEPVGVGTPYVESLVSYMSRLAASHSVSIYTLHKYVLAPLIKKTHVFAGRSAANSRGCVGSINGTGVIATDYVRALETLTLREDLRFLTLLGWSKVLVNRGLLNSDRVWCPVCLQEWRMMRRIVYEPLIWTLREVRICSRHHYPLRFKCPTCKRTQRWLEQRSRPGYCSKCQSWLGSENVDTSSGAGALEAETDHKYQKWVVKNIGEMLALTPKLVRLPSREDVAAAFMRCIEKSRACNEAAFAETFQIAPQQIYRWKTGKVRLQLPTTLWICHHLGVKLVNYLTGNIYVAKPVKKIDRGNVRQPPRRTDWKRVKRSLQKILHEQPPPSMLQVIKRMGLSYAVYQRLPDFCHAISVRHTNYRRSRKKAIESALKSILESNEFPPPSIAAIALKLGCYRTNLWRDFPELCKRISDRFLAYRKTLVEENRKRLQEEVRHKALALHRQGIYPSAPKVASLLSVPSRMSGEEARTALRETQNHLRYCQ